MGNRKLRSLMVKGYGCEGELKHGGEACDISEKDKRFVEALREAQPYIHLHGGSTFVVVISGELIATPSLDSVLKVLSFSFLTLFLSFRSPLGSSSSLFALLLIPKTDQFDNF